MTALVLLPGMDGTGALFVEFLSFLGEEIKPIVVSYPRDLPLGYEELEEFARSFLPANEPYVLLGESFSGPIAISLAAARPAGLVGVVLSCSYARNPVPWFGPLKGAVGLIPISSKLVGLVAPVMFGRFSSSVLRESLKRAIDSVTSAAIRARMRAALTVDYSEKLKEIQVPILYLQASSDLVVPAYASRQIVKYGQSVQLVKLRGAHLLLQVLPFESATVVEKFIKRVVADRRSISDSQQEKLPSP